MSCPSSGSATFLSVRGAAPRRGFFTIEQHRRGFSHQILDFANDCRYTIAAEHERRSSNNRSVARMLGRTIKNAAPFLTCNR